jgi:putative ABC transport system permease protein
LPLNLNVSSNRFYVEGRSTEAKDLPEIQQSAVGPDYLAAIGGRLVSGREFTDRDGPEAPPVALVNEAAARLLWPGASPIGRRFAPSDQGTPGRWREVVGVVRDLKVVTVGERPTPQVFYSAFQAFDTDLTVVARSRGGPTAAFETLRGAVRELDPGLPIMAGGPLQAVVTTALFPLRFGVGLLVVLGLVGLVIASIGLYGILAQGVAQRTRELGVRMALGARSADVQRLVIREGLGLTAIGVAVGLGLALLLGRLLGTWLYGVSPHDPLAFLLASVALGLVALLACWLPARRATRVDPMIALRAD